MNGTIKAIETRYKGYRFRSRLEARWAVFFDALGLDWEYEKEGFDLGRHGRYLPDFYITTLKVWVEIKPNTGFDPVAFGKCQTLASSGRGAGVFLIFGTPYPNEHIVYLVRKNPDRNLSGSFSETLEEGRYVFSLAGPDHRMVMHTDDEPIVARAFAAARSARFEHGENGTAK